MKAKVKGQSHKYKELKDGEETESSAVREGETETPPALLWSRRNVQEMNSVQPFFFVECT